MKHSAAMVIARYTQKSPTPRGETPVDEAPARVGWRAVRVGLACAACAFAFFAFSERTLFRRISLPGAVQGGSAPQRVQFRTPTPASAIPPAPVTASPLPLADAKAVTEPPSLHLPDDPDLRVTEFALSVSPDFQQLGKMQVRLSGVNPAANTFDITVKTSGREFYRQDVPVNEGVPIVKDAIDGPELVVGAISQNRVLGYIAEPIHPILTEADEEPAVPVTKHRRHYRRHRRR